jgi:hypothetical protein
MDNPRLVFRREHSRYLCGIILRKFIITLEKSQIVQEEGDSEGVWFPRDSWFVYFIWIW